MFDCMVKGAEIGLLSLWINLGRGKYFLNAYYYGHYNTIKYEIEKKSNQEQFLCTSIMFNAKFMFWCKQIDTLNNF